jgi:hypothetical protein
MSAARKKPIRKPTKRVEPIKKAEPFTVGDLWEPIVTIAKRPGLCLRFHAYVLVVYSSKDGTWNAFTGPNTEVKKTKNQNQTVLRAFNLAMESDAKTMAVKLRMLLDKEVK